MSLVKSKQRVVDHGEVFTPSWMVEAMLDLVKDETERIDARFLESNTAYQVFIDVCGRLGRCVTSRNLPKGKNSVQWPV
ncbi:MAG TPA: hypothetical protein PKV17_08400 [Aquabacterium sp.]|nr:hypothetical protein [Aquabacterium sp.]HRH28784.1 hypothetical protein [Aquabacterium sp.]